MKAYRKRYVLASVSYKGTCPNVQEMFESIKECFKEMFGLSNLYLSRLRLEGSFENNLIISVNSRFLSEIITAITLVGRGDDKNFTFDVLEISETIKRLKRGLEYKS